MSAPATGTWPRMRYFGDARMVFECDECELPEGVCSHCDEPFEDGDAGWVYCNGPAVHKECGVRSIIGGVNHQLGLCICCGGDRDPDPPGLSLREAARAALKLHHSKGQG